MRRPSPISSPRARWFPRTRRPERVPMRLQNRVALITGGGGGSGRAIARRFAGEGARVAVSGRRPAPLELTAAAIRQAGAEALAIAGDATVEADAEAMVRGTVERFGGLDILVNNAGAV